MKSIVSLLCCGLSALPLISPGSERRPGEARRAAPLSAPRLEADDPRLAWLDGRLQLAGQPFAGVLCRQLSDSLWSEVRYDEGLRHGLALRFDAQGRKVEERAYWQGQKAGVHRGWWPNGALRFRYRFEGGCIRACS